MLGLSTSTMPYRALLECNSDAFIKISDHQICHIRVTAKLMID